jgi:hypothetical protein
VFSNTASHNSQVFSNIATVRTGRGFIIQEMSCVMLNTWGAELLINLFDISICSAVEGIRSMSDY